MHRVHNPRSRAALASKADGAACCPICGGSYVPRWRLPGLVQCTACRFLSADLNISDDELAALYGEAYFKGEEYLDYIAEEPSLRVTFAVDLQPSGRSRRTFPAWF